MSSFIELTGECVLLFLAFSGVFLCCCLFLPFIDNDDVCVRPVVSGGVSTGGAPLLATSANVPRFKQRSMCWFHAALSFIITIPQMGQFTCSSARNTTAASEQLYMLVASFSLVEATPSLREEQAFFSSPCGCLSRSLEHRLSSSLSCSDISVAGPSRDSSSPVLLFLKKVSRLFTGVSSRFDNLTPEQQEEGAEK